MLANEFVLSCVVFWCLLSLVGFPLCDVFVCFVYLMRGFKWCLFGWWFG